jgi:hypothetical protein
MDPKLPFRLAPAAAVLASLSPLPAAALHTPMLDRPVIERVTRLRERLLQQETLQRSDAAAASAPLLAQTWNNWKKWNNA